MAETTTTAAAAVACPSMLGAWKVDAVIECLCFGPAHAQVERELLAACPNAYAAHDDDPRGEEGLNEWPEGGTHKDRLLRVYWNQLTPDVQTAIANAYNAEYGAADAEWDAKWGRSAATPIFPGGAVTVGVTPPPLHDGLDGWVLVDRIYTQQHGRPYFGHVNREDEGGDFPGESVSWSPDYTDHRTVRLATRAAIEEWLEERPGVAIMADVRQLRDVVASATADATQRT